MLKMSGDIPSLVKKSFHEMLKKNLLQKSKGRNCIMEANIVWHTLIYTNKRQLFVESQYTSTHLKNIENATKVSGELTLHWFLNTPKYYLHDDIPSSYPTALASVVYKTTNLFPTPPPTQDWPNKCSLWNSCFKISIYIKEELICHFTKWYAKEKHM